MKLYHATSKNNIENIIKNGLSGEQCKVRPGFLHFACDIETAEGYHQHWENSDTIIFSIETEQLDENKLGPDREDLMDILDQNEDYREWYECTWEESLIESGNCTYEGNIPFEKLKIEKTIEATPTFKI